MSALLSWINWCDRVGATLAGSSEAGALRASRLAETPLQRRWRTAAGDTTPTLDVDLGAAREIGVLALAQPDDAGCIDPDGAARGWMLATDTVRHRLDAVTAGAGALLDTGADPGGWQPGAGVSALRLGSPITARYWRTNLAAPSLVPSPGFIDLGRAWAGPAWQPERGNFSWGYGRAWDDGSVVQRNPVSGLETVLVGPNARVLTFGFKTLTSADAMVIDEMLRVVGRRGQVLFVPFPDAANPAAQPVIGRLQDVPPITQPTFATCEVVFQLRQTL